MKAKHKLLFSNRLWFRYFSNRTFSFKCSRYPYVVGGEATQGWLIIRSGVATIGLFQGMFDRNMLTFNPGWNAKGETIGSFTDVRDIQRDLLSKGLSLKDKVDESSSGPDNIMLIDPDGNPILIDQHVGQ